MLVVTVNVIVGLVSLHNKDAFSFGFIVLGVVGSRGKKSDILGQTLGSPR